MEKPILTIIIPTIYGDGLPKMLESLYKYTPPIFKVIVIDNSGDGSPVKPELYGLIHLYIRSYRNLGYAKSFNTGLLLSNTPYVAIANDDIEFMYDGWWEGILKTFKNHPRIAAVNPMSPRNPYHTGDIIEQYPYQKNWNEKDIKKIEKIFGGGGIIDGICMWFTIFKREALEELGQMENSPYGIALMDEAFGPGSGEDYDFNRRFGLKNFRCVATKNSYVWHWWGLTKNKIQLKGVTEGVSANHLLIGQGYATMNKKWGEVNTNNPKGWDIQGHSGPKEPLNDMPYYSIIDL